MKSFKTLAAIAAAFFITTTVSMAQPYTSRTDIQRGEKWWGFYVEGKGVQPLMTPFDLNTAELPPDAHARQMMLSSTGRYIWSDNPMRISFDGKTFTITSEHEKIEAVKGGKNLRDAYLVCCHKHFPPKGDIPDIRLFTYPQYDLSLELGFSQGYHEVTNYAHSLLKHDYLPGIITIPEGWRTYNKGYLFNTEFYPDVAGMLEELHRMGFLVMVTITPYTPAFGREYNEGVAKGWFLRDADGSPAIIDTRGGKAVCYDVSDDAQFDYIMYDVSRLMKETEIDGFLYDCREALPVIMAKEDEGRGFMKRWSEMGNSNHITEHTVSFDKFMNPHTLPGFGHTNEITFDKTPEQIRELRAAAIYDAIAAGINGFPYCRVHIPLDEQKVLASDESMAKYLQLEAAMPAMKIAFNPERIQNSELRKEVRVAINSRVWIGQYIEELLKESAVTAEPVIRHMEYQFPGMGLADCDDQFMLGPKYLIAPDIKGDGKRMVRIPKGTWTDRDGRKFKGPQVAEISCPGFRSIVLELSGK